MFLVKCSSHSDFATRQKLPCMVMLGHLPSPLQPSSMGLFPQTDSFSPSSLPGPLSPHTGHCCPDTSPRGEILPVRKSYGETGAERWGAELLLCTAPWQGGEQMQARQQWTETKQRVVKKGTRFNVVVTGLLVPGNFASVHLVLKACCAGMGINICFTGDFSTAELVLLLHCICRNFPFLISALGRKLL